MTGDDRAVMPKVSTTEVLTLAKRDCLEPKRGVESSRRGIGEVRGGLWLVFIFIYFFLGCSILTFFASKSSRKCTIAFDYIISFHKYGPKMTMAVMRVSTASKSATRKPKTPRSAKLQ